MINFTLLLQYCKDICILYNKFRKLSLSELPKLFYIMETDEEKRQKCYKTLILLFLIGAILGFIVYPFLIYLFWNTIVVSIFEITKINYFIALFIAIIVNHIFSFIERKF